MLEVIKADSSVNLIPVSNFLIQSESWIRAFFVALKAAVYLLIIKNVEQLLKQESTAKVFCQVSNFPSTSHGKDSIKQDSKIMGLLDERPSLLDGWVHVWVANVGDTSRFNLLLVDFILAHFFTIWTFVVGILLLGVVLHFLLLPIEVDGLRLSHSAVV